MSNEKNQIIETVKTLPDNTTCEDAIYALYINSKLNKSEEDINNGRVMSIEESKEMMRKNMRVLISTEAQEDIIRETKSYYPILG